MTASERLAPPIPMESDRGMRRQVYRIERRCWVCNVSFFSARPQADTCSVKCRQAKRRIKLKAALEAERLIEVEEAKRRARQKSERAKGKRKGKVVKNAVRKPRVRVV